jgi:hypothetical protein
MAFELAESCGVIEVVSRIGAYEEKHIQGIASARGHRDFESRLPGLGLAVG